MREHKKNMRVSPYRRGHVHRTDIAVILGACLRTARGGLLPDYAHQALPPFILHRTKVVYKDLRALL